MVTLTITNGPQFKVTWTENMNAQTVLETAYNDPSNKRRFSYMLQYYGSGLGYLVDMINGTFDTFPIKHYGSKPYFYWEFLVNGKASGTGIDQTTVQDGDKVVFTYSAYDPTTHAGTTVEAKHKFKTSA